MNENSISVGEALAQNLQKIRELSGEMKIISAQKKAVQENIEELLSIYAAAGINYALSEDEVNALNPQQTELFV